VWTGDSPRHNGDPLFHPITLTTTETLVEEVTYLITSSIPIRQNKIPVYPTIGNNDVYPHDVCLQGPNVVRIF
jgi:hypothetical protein